jgi:hypothetical protein
MFRVQMNTLEWMPIFLPSLWLFAIYISDPIAAGLGLVWIVGRILYMTAMCKPPKNAGQALAFKRSPPSPSCSAHWARSSGASFMGKCKTNPRHLLLASPRICGGEA